MRRFCSILAAGIAMALIGLAQQASTPGPYKVLKTAKTGGLGGFDYIYADDAGRRLYIPRGAVQGETPTPARVTIFNLDTLAQVGEKEFADRRALEGELSILRKRLRTNIVPGEHSHLETIRGQLADYFSGRKLEFDIPLAPVGSAFQLRAWEILRSIPVGETRSYSWMAKQLGDENARRAVGRANGTNMICIVIPCYRVIRADGTLCGYGGGLWRKKWLLDHERRFYKKMNGDR